MSQKNLSANHCTQANDTRSFCPSLLSDTATISVHSETDGTPSSIPVRPLPHSASTTQTMPSDSTPAPLLPCMPSCFPNPLPASSSHLPRSSIALSRFPDHIAHSLTPLPPLPSYPSASLYKKSIECHQTAPALPFPRSGSFPTRLYDTPVCISQVDIQIPLLVHSPAVCSYIPSAYGSTTSIARSPFPRGQVYPFYRPIVARYIPGTILQVQYLLRIRKRYYQRRISPYPLMRYIHSSLTFPIGTRYRSIHIYQRLFKFLFPSFYPYPSPHRVYALHEIPDIFRRKPPRKIPRRCWIRYPLRSHCI